MMTAYIPTWLVLTISAAVTVLLLYAAKHFYQQYKQRKMQDEVRNILCEYLPLEEFEAQADARKKAFNNKNQSQTTKFQQQQQNSSGRGREKVGVRFEDVATVV